MDQHATHVLTPVLPRDHDLSRINPLVYGVTDVSLTMIRVAIRNRMYARNTVSTSWRRPLQVVVSVTRQILPRFFPGKARGLCSSTLGIVPPIFPRRPILLTYNVVLWYSSPGGHRQERPRWRRRAATTTTTTTAVPRFSTTDWPPRDHQPVPSTHTGVVLSISRCYYTTVNISHGALKRYSPLPAADGVHNV